MSAFELNDLMMSWYAMMGQDASMYLALVSGYLLVAHYIGAKLSRAQSVVINVFFTVWTMLHVLALFSEMRAVVEIQQRLVDMGEFHFQTPSESLYLASMFMVLQLAGILAALYFMWTVRHPAQLRK